MNDWALSPASARHFADLAIECATSLRPLAPARNVAKDTTAQCVSPLHDWRPSSQPPCSKHAQEHEPVDELVAVQHKLSHCSDWTSVPSHVSPIVEQYRHAGRASTDAAVRRVNKLQEVLSAHPVTPRGVFASPVPPRSCTHRACYDHALSWHCPGDATACVRPAERVVTVTESAGEKHMDSTERFAVATARSVCRELGFALPEQCVAQAARAALVDCVAADPDHEAHVLRRSRALARKGYTAARADIAARHSCGCDMVARAPHHVVVECTYRLLLSMVRATASQCVARVRLHKVHAAKFGLDRAVSARAPSVVAYAAAVAMTVSEIDGVHIQWPVSETELARFFARKIARHAHLHPEVLASCAQCNI